MNYDNDPAGWSGGVVGVAEPRGPRASSAKAPGRHSLSPREAEVLEWLKHGLSEKEVAEELGVSTHTVHTYVKGLYRVFQVRTRAELMAWCLAGLRPPERYRLKKCTQT